MLRPETPIPGLRGLPLYPDDEGDPYVFRLDLSTLGIGSVRVVFSAETGAPATAFHLEMEPLMSFDKRSASRIRRCGRSERSRWNGGRGCSAACQSQRGGIDMNVATITELWRMSATELAAAIRDQNQVSSREVVEAHLRRIEEVNPSINAVPVVLAEQALEAAKAADRITNEGGEPPLARCPRHHQIEHRRRRDADDAGIEGAGRRIRAWTPPTSSACVPPGPSRSAGPTCRPSRCAGTPTANSGARP